MGSQKTHRPSYRKRELRGGESQYGRTGVEMGLDEVPEVGVVLEPLVMFFIGEPLIPETTTSRGNIQEKLGFTNVITET